MKPRQEIFTQVATHLLTQNAKSRNSFECKYRSPRGLKCAAGCLIADEHYSEDFEGAIVIRGPFKGDRVCDALVASGVAEEDLPLVAELQRIHDQHSADSWREQLTQLAEKEGLEMPQ